VVIVMDKSGSRLAGDVHELWRQRSSDINICDGVVVVKLTASGCGWRKGLWGHF
jgi:hypothetical protein